MGMTVPTHRVVARRRAFPDHALDQRAGIKVGPTERIGLLSGAAAVELAAGADASGAAGAVAVVPAGAAPFLAAAAAPLVGARDIFLALSSVTMMSPCCSAAALSSIVFSASDQVCPAALHAQDGLNSWRKRKAFGEEE